MREHATRDEMVDAPGWRQTALAVWMPPTGIFLGSLLGAVAWFLYARRSARVTRYRCGQCGAAFPISSWTEFASLRADRIPRGGVKGGP